MTHVTCRLTAKDRDQLRNPTLGNRVWASFTFFIGNVYCLFACSVSIDRRSGEVTVARPLTGLSGATLEYVLLATDGANASTTALLTINVLDSQAQGPRFSSNQYTATVPELQTDLLPSVTVYVRRRIVAPQSCPWVHFV